MVLSDVRWRAREEAMSIPNVYCGGCGHTVYGESAKKAAQLAMRDGWRFIRGKFRCETCCVPHLRRFEYEFRSLEYGPRVQR